MSESGFYRRLCQHCGQLSEAVEPLCDFMVGWGMSDSHRSFFSDDIMDRPIRLGKRCGCYDLFKYGNRTGEALEANFKHLQVRYIVIWIDGKGRYAGAGYRNFQSREVSIKEIPVTMAVLLAMEQTRRTDVLEDILSHPNGLNQLLCPPIDLEVILNPRDKVRDTQMIQTSRRATIDYLRSPERAHLREKLLHTQELVEVLRLHRVTEIGPLPTDPKSSVNDFLKR